ncbi:hypothetical protein EUGRSUZ_A01694 [Eucalyptus grandis]|uniref:Uncharacterized protein n=2 Tax=Eucalyptus grandis TaxID=71139 RepID=A0ACC3LGF4_EUCGR|nr:hypothetical protein EUGRSUZ_A01694 [Eucalyptus grandis]
MYVIKFTSSSGVPPKLRTNLAIHSKWGEINGDIVDLGTYIPIVLALTLAKDLNLGTTLIFTGVYNMVIGAIHGVPMPVQPMKVIAAVGILSADFGILKVMAVGICAGVILGVLGGSFGMTSVKYIRKVQDFSKSKTAGNRHWFGLDGLVVAIVCACFILVINGAGVENEETEGNRESGDDIEDQSSMRKRIMMALPSAFIIFLLVVRDFKFGPSSIEVVKTSRHAWKEGFIIGTIPQLPLSILNSVIAVCKLSYDLFPEKDFSVGCWFGAMPCCHGAGGLAGQCKFDGRSGGCMAILGAAKLILGLVLGSSLVKVLDQFPVGVLGVLLLFAGIELAMAAWDMNSKEEAFVMLISAAVSLVG